VEDDGGGVAPEDRARIFEPFGRGTGTTTSGVGLSICRAIVEAHGGTIGVEQGERGARFVFTVPAWAHG
jgi:signal transduction histidine kinase